MMMTGRDTPAAAGVWYYQVSFLFSFFFFILVAQKEQHKLLFLCCINRGVHTGKSGVKVKNESEAKVEKAWQK
jgi:hypothetical protein